MGLLMARYRRVLVINSQGYSQCYSRRKNLRHLRNLRDFIQKPDRSQKICVHLCNLWDNVKNRKSLGYFRYFPYICTKLK